MNWSTASMPARYSRGPCTAAPRARPLRGGGAGRPPLPSAPCPRRSPRPGTGQAPGSRETVRGVCNVPAAMPERTIWREATVLREYDRLAHDPIFRGEGVEDPGDQPVLLIPGFLTADNSLSAMGAWLKRTGHHPFRTRNGVNIACGEWAVTRLERRLDELAQRTGRRVAIVGHSRGGHFARVLAVRRPDLVSGIVTLGAPP